MKVLVDEMYPAAVAEALQASRIDATTVAALRLGGASDAEIFGAAVAGGLCVLTENVGDFARIATEHSTGGRHHAGVLIALSSRFSRRPAGLQPLGDAIQAIADEPIEDRVIYLEPVAGWSSRPAVPRVPRVRGSEGRRYRGRAKAGLCEASSRIVPSLQKPAFGVGAHSRVVQGGRDSWFDANCCFLCRAVC